MSTSTIHHGAGVEWTHKLEDAIVERFDEIDCFELIPENFFDTRGDDFLKKLGAAGIPTLVHGVEMSLASDQPFKQKHFDRIRRVIDMVNTVQFSDHLAITESLGVEICQLTPPVCSQAAADVVCRQIDHIQRQINIPVAIENVTHRFQIPFQEMTEPEFINLITERTGSTLLLDVTNVFTNATNFNFDPYSYIDALNLDQVSAIHLAGGHYDEEGTLLDSHSHEVPEGVWDIYRYVVKRAIPQATIVERTGNHPQYDDLLTEVKKAQFIIEEHQPKPRKAVNQ